MSAEYSEQGLHRPIYIQITVVGCSRTFRCKRGNHQTQQLPVCGGRRGKKKNHEMEKELLSCYNCLKHVLETHVVFFLPVKFLPDIGPKGVAPIFFQPRFPTGWETAPKVQCFHHAWCGLIAFRGYASGLWPATSWWLCSTFGLSLGEPWFLKWWNGETYGRRWAVEPQK